MTCRVAVDIRMPLLGDVMQEGTLVEWLKKDQEWVEKGQPLFCVETDKATFEIEAPGSGRLQPLAKVGEIVAVGGTVGRLWAEGEDSAREVRASPIARRLARERGLDLVQVLGTGPGGRITVDDVTAHLERSQTRGAAPPLVEEREEEGKPTVIALRGRRRTIAERMLSSLQTTAQLTIGQEVDVTRMVDFRAQLLEPWEKQESVRVTYTDIVVKAAALALRDHPLLNAVMAGDEIHLMPTINISLAIHAEEGLTAPVIRGADRHSLLDLARTARRLVDRARAGRLTPEDLGEGSFTVSSMGSYGPDWFTPIINPPQVAILGIGRIRRRPALINGLLAEHQVVNLCLTFDHRALDGVPAARFLGRVAELLHSPQTLL